MVKNYMKSFARYAGIITVLFEWLALLLFYVYEPLYFTGEQPISYFATLPQTRIIFTICYLIAAVSFWIFAKYYLKEYYQASVKIFTFSMVCFAGFALLPYDPANTSSMLAHDVLVQSSFGSFLLGMYLMARRRSDDKQFRIVTILSVTLSALLMVLFVVIPKDSHLHLVLEAGSWMAFQLWIIWVSYRSYRNSRKNFLTGANDE